MFTVLRRQLCSGCFGGMSDNFFAATPSKMPLQDSNSMSLSSSQTVRRVTEDCGRRSGGGGDVIAFFIYFILMVWLGSWKTQDASCEAGLCSSPAHRYKFLSDRLCALPVSSFNINIFAVSIIFMSYFYVCFI